MARQARKNTNLVENLKEINYRFHTITGLRKGTSHAILYTELGWVPLKECRRTNKLILLYKILHDETPLYLLNEILLQANRQSSYNLRFNRVLEPPFCNTTSYKCSFFPNVIDSWNLLDVDTQNQHNRLVFKKQIRSNILINSDRRPLLISASTDVIISNNGSI